MHIVSSQVRTHISPNTLLPPTADANSYQGTQILLLSSLHALNENTVIDSLAPQAQPSSLVVGLISSPTRATTYRPRVSWMAIGRSIKWGLLASSLGTSGSRIGRVEAESAWIQDSSLKVRSHLFELIVQEFTSLMWFRNRYRSLLRSARKILQACLPSCQPC